MTYLHLSSLLQKIAQESQFGIALLLQLCHAFPANRAIKILSELFGGWCDLYQNATAISYRAHSPHISKPLH
jgi:hypothetical protein